MQRADERALLSATPSPKTTSDSAGEKSAVTDKKQQFLLSKININAATEGELIRLPRIGPALAKRIMAYRQKNGPFHSTQELRNVKGIGEKTLSVIKERITVE